MNITAASLSRLEAGNYYLSNTTGTIKKANFWQWIKCLTGLGDGRAKAQRLADAVKESLLTNAELKQDAALSGEIGRLDTNHSLSGATLRDIAGRFKTAHADAIAAVDARREASRIAEQVADASVNEWVAKDRVLAAPENVAYVRKIARYSVQHLVEKAYEDREVQSDLQGRMESAMRKAIESINAIEYMQAAHGCRLGYPITNDNGEKRRKLPTPRVQFDELHFRAILAALITKDGLANMGDFTQRMLLLFQEDILQERKDALLSIPLEPPETPLSGFVFAVKATQLYKAMEDSEWHRQSME